MTEPNNAFQIEGPVIGQCASFTPIVALTQPLPVGFQTTITWANEPIRVQLGQDNAYVALVDLNRAFCSTSAVRVSYNGGSMKSMNLGLVMFILLITIAIMKS